MATFTDKEVREILISFAIQLNQRDGQTLPTIVPAERFLDRLLSNRVTEQEHQAHYERSKTATHGRVVFFEINKDKTITQSGITEILPIGIAFDVYANTPNPASQLMQFKTEEEHQLEHIYLNKCIKDKQWLEQLFNCI